MVAIKTVRLGPTIEALIHTTMRYTNPAYVSAVRFGNHYAPRPEQFINEYTVDGNYHILPRAAGVRLLKELGVTPINTTVDTRASHKDLQLTLKDHQVDALEKFIDMLDANDSEGLPTDGYISLQPGAGKTITALACIVAAKAKALIVVPTREIEATWVADISKALGVKSSDIGRIRGATVKSDHPITVGSVQTLMRIPPEQWGQFGITVIDEVHRMGAKIFCNVVRNSNSRIRLGLTATDYRKDGAFHCVKHHIGEAIVKSEVRHNVVPLHYHSLMTNFGLTSNKQEYTFNDLLHDLENNYRRTDVITKAIEYIAENYPGDILVVSPRTLHLDFLRARLLGSNLTSTLVTGATKNRDKVFQDICAGLYKITFATTSIMSEGASNYRWHHVLNTMPFSDKKQAIQLSGRACRQGPGKDKGIFWDIVDENPMARAMYKSRWAALKKHLAFTRTFHTHPDIALKAEHKGIA